MKKTFFGAVTTVALLAGLALLAASPARAGTEPITYTKVYFASGPHQRQPRTVSGSSGGFATISSQSGGNSATGLSVVPSLSPLEQLNGQIYVFAFATVTGGSATAGGPAAGLTTTSYQNPPTAWVENAPINILEVFVPQSVCATPPCSGGGWGATIDSFDESTGALFDDTFVAVSPDSTGALTKSGNVEGYVDTSNAETITALSPTSPTGVNFSRWVTLGGSTSPAAALPVGKHVSISALAFYDAPPPGLLTAKQACQQEAANLQLIITDRGPLLLVAQYNAVAAALETCVREGYLGQAYVTQLETEYHQMAETRSGGGPQPPPVH